MSYWTNITGIVDEQGILRDEKYCDLLKNLDGEKFGEFLSDEVGLKYQSAVEFLVNTLKYVTYNVDKFE
jgi:hypothetical protein